MKKGKSRKHLFGHGLALFFCLFPVLVFASTPTLGTITPSSGSIAPNTAQTFICKYNDASGWAHLKEADLLISTSTTALANSAYVYYDQNSNLLYLRNDANSAWLGGYAPGSANTIENSQAKLNCASSSISGSGNTLTVNWNITFKTVYSGKKYNTYLYAKDDAGAYINFTSKGTYTVNSTPQIGSIIPSSGVSKPDALQNFSTSFSDADGWANLQYVYFLVSTSSATLTNCFYGYYNQNTNKLYLRNDANSSWSGGYAPGSANVIENSYSKLNCANTTVSGSGVNLTVNWAVTFKSGFTGVKKMYLYVMDDLNVSVNWTEKGAWSIINDTTPPSGSVKINNDAAFTTAAQVTLTLSATDSGSGMGSGAQMQFSNDNLNWSTPEAYNTSKSWALSSGDGDKTVYVKFKDAAGNWSGVFSDTIKLDATAPTGTIKINNDATYTNSNSVTLTLSSTDTASGMGAGAQLQFSNDNITWSAPESFVTAKTRTLSSGDGNKTVYVKFKDAAGNWSPAYSDTIVLDTTPPVLSIYPVSSPTNQDVAVTYSSSDNITPANQIVVTGNNSPYTQEGLHTVTLTARDLAGNSSTASVSFTIDKTPPVIIITSPLDGAVVESSPVQLEGTIDGVAFSESRTLTEGANILTKSAVDAAGNSRNVSITVHLYLGQTVGPQGGEVVSADGKVKVVIPAGALTEPTQIKVLPVQKEAYQGMSPSGTALLSVVECKPYGLVFNKPVDIVYTLSQGEVPGTPVELGFYDSVQNKIVSTGQTSIVPADGFTLRFSIMHFSTYAALKNLTPQNTPIGSGVKIPLPDMLTGAFSHSIPISVSPGRKGLKPGPALVYRSGNANSWVGLGFSLNPGYIVRSTRLGPPSYVDTQDTFYLITDAGTTELVHLVDNLYQSKIESAFAKYFKETDDSWRVVGKDGSVMRFGQTDDSKEISGKGTFAWYLTKVIDTNGNYIDFNYTKDSGKSYLSRIDYTGNLAAGVSPTNSVEFFTEARDDVFSSYISSSKIVTAKRLKEIQVKVNLDLVWRYELQYAYSPDTNRSLLKSVKQFSSDNKSLPEQGFTYQQAK